MDAETAKRAFIHIEVPDNHVEVINYTNKQNQPAVMRRQSVYLCTGDLHPEKIERMLEAADSAWEPGRYALASNAFRQITDKNGRVQRSLTPGFQIIPLESLYEILDALGVKRPPHKVAA